VRAFSPAVLGVFCLFVAGFVHAGERHSADPELVLGFAYAFGGLGLLFILTAGVALGVRLARD
jgi:thiol:disulfide interchange protein